ncbi:hypothetical protein KAJ27_16765 [bacterium]|nr:hypothetical protein [bacterium]
MLKFKRFYLILFAVFISSTLYSSDISETEIIKTIERLKEPVYINFSNFKPVQAIINLGIIDNEDKGFTFSIIDDQINIVLDKKNKKISMHLEKNGKAVSMLHDIVNKCIEKDYFQVINYGFSKRKNMKKHASMFIKWVNNTHGNLRRKKWFKHRNRSLGYQINYPDSWELNKNMYSFVREHDNKSQASTKVFLSVNIADSDCLTLESWLKLYQNKLIKHDKEKNKDHFRHFENNKLSYKIAGKVAILQKKGIMDSKGNFKRKPDNKWTRVYIKVNERIFIFELHNPNDGMNNKKFQKITKRMLKSLRVF